MTLQAPTLPADLAVEVVEPVLAAYENGFAAASVVLPARRYVWVGTPAADCDQLVVAVNRLYKGIPPVQAAEPLRSGDPSARGIEIDVWLWRCVPAGSDAGPPSPEALGVAAERLLADGWLLQRIPGQALAAGRLAACDALVVGETDARTGDGGLAGWRQRLDLQY